MANPDDDRGRGVAQGLAAYYASARPCPECRLLAAERDAKTALLSTLQRALGMTVTDGMDWTPEEQVAWCRQLRRNRDETLKEFASMEAERDALQRFKDFVHRYLDGKGIPTHPEGPHSAEGCRIGDRMGLVFAELEHLRRQLEERGT